MWSSTWNPTCQNWRTTEQIRRLDRTRSLSVKFERDLGMPPAPVWTRMFHFLEPAAGARVDSGSA